MRQLLQLPGLALVASLIATGCAHTPPDNPGDPLEPVNRPIWQFNNTADRYVLRPVTRTYANVTPDPVETGIDNFLSNLVYPVTIANDLFQLKLHYAAADITRLLVNTSVGLVGIFDVATGLGLPERDEDFGQTLGYWGVGQGVYLMLPFLGPSTGRDLTGYGVDYFLDPTFYIDRTATEWTLHALYLLNLRAGLLGFDQTVRNAFDPYAFIRTAYLQRRLSKVHDGDPPRPQSDDSE